MPNAVERCRENSSNSVKVPSSSRVEDPLARGHLALGVLLLDGFRGARALSRADALAEVGNLALGRVDVDLHGATIDDWGSLDKGRSAIRNGRRPHYDRRVTSFLDQNALSEGLSGTGWGPVELVDSTASTNADLAAAVRAGASEGRVRVTD